MTGGGTAGRQAGEAWRLLDPDPPLFASEAWLEFMSARIEGSHRRFVSAAGTPDATGFFGTVIGDSGVSESKNPWQLLFEPCGLRTLTPEATESQAAARAGGPPREAWFPSLVLMYPGLECFPAGPGRHRPAALDRAVADLVGQARDEGLRSVAFLYVQPEERALAEALGRAGFAEFPLALRCNLRPPGTSFADYRATLSRSAVHSMDRIRRRMAERGVSFCRFPLTELDDAGVERLVELRLQHRAKYGRRPDASGERDQLTTLRGTFGDRAEIVAALADERIIGFCLFLDAGDVRHAWSNGTDYTDSRSKDTYFEVCYYWPVEDSYRTGRKELSFSYGAESIKIERGCRLDEVSGFVLPLDDGDLESARRAARALAGGLARPGRTTHRTTTEK
ncbi:GNAT family N-acetyltransferase [Streptomyces sp. NPDC029080]|uniref:GNAT family N-acetyltransferase n=1 Tax=Streptomyces sp. NPDC029080 TaxID=3155017 RepID=UPI0033FC67EC